jgi:hypothetical protein
MISGTIINNAGGSIIGDFNAIAATGNTSIFNAGTISANNGPAIVFSSGGNMLTLGPGSVINGAVVGSGMDTFQLGGTGAGTFDVSALGAQYTGFTTFNKVDSSAWTVTGTQTVTTPWTISSGTLIVNGSIANSSLTTIDNGGTLGGTGIVGATQVNAGGTLAPGNAANATGTLTVAGNLTLQTGALYLVTVAGASASKTDVSGTAALAGNVQVATPNAKAGTYDILHSAGLNGTTFSGATSLNPNFAVSLGYTPTDVFSPFRRNSAPILVSTPISRAYRAR